MNILVIGCDQVGASLIRDLERIGHDISLIERDPEQLKRLDAFDDYRFGGTALVGDPTDPDVLRRGGVENCDAVAAAARAAGVQVGVVSQLRYGPAVARVKRALESGALGRITRCDLYMKYFRPQSYYDSGTWRGTQAMDGGGALMNQGIHGVDLVRYLMGPADSIYALSGTLVRDIEVEDTLTAVVAWHCGAQGVIQASVGDYPGFPRRIELNGESGTIILEEDRIVKWEVAGDSAYHIYEQEPAPEVRSHSEALATECVSHTCCQRNSTVGTSRTIMSEDRRRDFTSCFYIDIQIFVDVELSHQTDRTINQRIQFILIAIGLGKRKSRTCKYGYSEQAIGIIASDSV